MLFSSAGPKPTPVSIATKINTRRWFISHFAPQGRSSLCLTPFAFPRICCVKRSWIREHMLKIPLAQRPYSHTPPTLHQRHECHHNHTRTHHQTHDDEHHRHEGRAGLGGGLGFSHCSNDYTASSGEGETAEPQHLGKAGAWLGLGDLTAPILQPP